MAQNDQSGWHEDFEDEAHPVELNEDDGHLSSSWCEDCGLHWTDCDCPPAPDSPADSPPW
jgi:hypothetical protein